MALGIRKNLPITFRIAERLQQVGPVAPVDALVVGQPRGAGFLLRDPEGTLDVAGGALVTVRVDAELVLAAGG